MGLKNLHILCDLAELGSWSATAQQHQVSVRQIMEQIRDLEKCLGVPIFQRNTRRLVVTPEGKEIVEAAGRVLVYHEGLKGHDVEESSLSFVRPLAEPSLHDTPLSSALLGTVSADVLSGEIRPSEHLVQLYGSDQELISSLKRFVLGGFEKGETVVLIATESHLKLLAESLRRDAWEIEAAQSEGSLILLEAEAALENFMVRGWPDEKRFVNWISGLLAGAKQKGPRVRAFGEMVAILWARGNKGATIRLEQLWNIVLKQEKLPLLCAYPRASFAGETGADFREICATHSQRIA